MDTKAWRVALWKHRKNDATLQKSVKNGGYHTVTSSFHSARVQSDVNEVNTFFPSDDEMRMKFESCQIPLVFSPCGRVLSLKDICLELQKQDKSSTEPQLQWWWQLMTLRWRDSLGWWICEILEVMGGGMVLIIQQVMNKRHSGNIFDSACHIYQSIILNYDTS